MKVKDGSIQESGQKDILGMALGNPEHSGRVRGVGGMVTPTTYFYDAPKPGDPVDHRQPVETPVNIRYPDITLICLIYGDPFLYNFLTINQFVMIFHKSLMYNSFTLLYAKIY